MQSNVFGFNKGSSCLASLHSVVGSSSNDWQGHWADSAHSTCQGRETDESAGFFLCICLTIPGGKLNRKVWMVLFCCQHLKKQLKKTSTPKALQLEEDRCVSSKCLFSPVYYGRLWLYSWLGIVCCGNTSGFVMSLASYGHNAGIDKNQLGTWHQCCISI